MESLQVALENVAAAQNAVQSNDSGNMERTWKSSDRKDLEAVNP